MSVNCLAPPCSAHQWAEAHMEPVDSVVSGDSSVTGHATRRRRGLQQQRTHDWVIFALPWSRRAASIETTPSRQASSSVLTGAWQSEVHHRSGQSKNHEIETCLENHISCRTNWRDSSPMAKSVEAPRRT